MPTLLTLRPLTREEAAAVERPARSRTAPARAVERPHSVELGRRGWRVPAVAREVGASEQTTRRWPGASTTAASARPPTYPPEAVGEAVASLTKPDDLGLPFGSWTLDRLAAYLDEERGIAIKRSRIGEILAAEGLRWRKQEAWFGERPDPAFAAKRGRSSGSTRRRPRAAW